MPVHKVKTASGQTGYRWGSSGKVYTGAQAQARATRQGQAAYASGYKPKRKK